MRWFIVLSVLVAVGQVARGEWSVTARTREHAAPDAPWVVAEKQVSIDPKQTALIIIDVWDKHWCEGANRRVGPIAPRINEVANKLREQGALIIHAPSDTMKTYEGMPQRQLAQNAPRHEPPVPIARWNYIDSSSEGKLPIDDSDGGCDCTPQCKTFIAWKGEHPAIKIDAKDAISDNGVEIYNLLSERKIKTVLVCGVHANMCILGRSFGIRQLVREGFATLLMRDLTDTMYNPRMSPMVPHERGTDAVVRHIESFWCPSFLSSDILGDSRPQQVVFAINESEYHARETLPVFAKELEEKLKVKTTLMIGTDVKELPDTEAIDAADVLVIFMRRTTLNEEQLGRFKKHFNAGKPVIGLRTASHAFQNYLEFDHDVLGGNYHNHHANERHPQITLAPSAQGNLLLKNLPAFPFTSQSSLYKTSPLAATSQVLLMGTIDGESTEPVAWTNQHLGGKVFYTSLGHPEDFKQPQFWGLLMNAVKWELERPVR